MTSDGADRQLAQSRLKPDLALIQEYGSAHPESYSSVRFRNEPEVQLVAGFVTDVAEHEAAILRMVARPDSVIVERHPVSRRERHRIIGEVRAIFDELRAKSGRFVAARSAPGTERVEIQLPADQEPLAAELSARYGDAVDLQVGNLSYPDRVNRYPTLTPRRPPLVVDPPQGLDLRLEASPSTVPYGFSGSAVLHLANVGPEPVRIPGQHHVAQVLDDDGRAVGNQLWSWPAHGLRPIDLEPGGSTTRPVLWTTASWYPEYGYLLPPGVYRLQTSVVLEKPEDAPSRVARPPAVPITIVS